MEDRRIAILIGNGKFSPAAELSELRGPANDVAALEAVLSHPGLGGFEIVKFLDRAKSEIEPTVEAILNAATERDTVLVFYAGHGTQDKDGRLCLATSETVAFLQSTSIAASDLIKHIHQGNAGTVILLLDCCYSGAIEREFATRDANRPRSELERAAGDIRGLHIITATTGTQTAREREPVDTPNGLVMGNFTRQIVDGLLTGKADDNHDGVISVHDLEQHLFKTVKHQTPRKFAHRASGDPWISKVAQVSEWQNQVGKNAKAVSKIQLGSLVGDVFSLGQLVGGFLAGAGSFTVLNYYIPTGNLMFGLLFVGFCLFSSVLACWACGVDETEDWRLFWRAVKFNASVYVAMAFCIGTFYSSSRSGSFSSFHIAVLATLPQLLPPIVGLLFRRLFRGAFGTRRR